MAVYIHQLNSLPDLTWDRERVYFQLTSVRHLQGRLLGRMESMEQGLRKRAHLSVLAGELIASWELEGPLPDRERLQEAIAVRLGSKTKSPVDWLDPLDGLVGMAMDICTLYEAPLTESRLQTWYAAVGEGSQPGVLVHYQEPGAQLSGKEMSRYLRWLNDGDALDPVIKAGIAHLWFVSMRGFGHGNGRIARAITEMLLCRSDRSGQRYYSLSSQICLEREEYIRLLSEARLRAKGWHANHHGASSMEHGMDITEWLVWFIACLGRALDNTGENLRMVFRKARFWEKHLTTPMNERQVMMLNRVLDGLEEKLTTSLWAKVAKTSQDTAGRDVNELVQRGILTKDGPGGRSTRYSLV